jgi:5-methylcytosine-specific restriction endonuclease McrA
MSVSLRSLSDNDILSRTRALTVQERTTTLLLLAHLNEIERRRLHLKQGYASMFDYCTTGLGYSASAASRRIRVARCIARFPEVCGLLESNEVNLSTISQVSRILSPENKDRVLAQIRGRSQREVEAVVAEYEPRVAIPPDRVRTVVMRVPVGTTQGPGKEKEAQNTPVLVCRTAEEHNRNGCNSDSPSCPQADTPMASATPKLERRALIQFSASEAFMAKLETIRSLAWHRLPANPSLEQLFELAMDHFIEKEDPSARKERREKREDRSHAKGGMKREPRPAGERSSGTPRPARPRHVAAAVKDEVFTRDRGRCSYVGASGRRCASTRALQIDHVEPIARGGKSTPGNLRLLCAFHNRLEAERILGNRWLAGTRPSPPPAPGRGSSRATPP